jgi:hypothetical protein
MVKEKNFVGVSISEYKKPTREEKMKMSVKELGALPEQVISDASNQFAGLYNIFKMLQMKPENGIIVNEFTRMISQLKEFDEYIDVNYTNYSDSERKKIAENVKTNYQNLFIRYNTCVRMFKEISEDNYIKEAGSIFRMTDILIADIRKIEESE